MLSFDKLQLHFMKIFAFLFILVNCATLQALDWKPVPLEQLSLKTPKLDANADAESIFWEAYVRDDPAGNGYLNHIVENYIRIKLYNDRAVQNYGNVEIPYYSERKMTVSQIRARTIRSDGSIVEVAGSAVSDGVLSKAGKSKTKAKSFALPALEPGAIIEYQWVEVYSEYIPRYVPLIMQREIPMWLVSYKVRPVREFGFSEQMRAHPFNCNPSPWEPVQKDLSHPGFVETHVNNVPAFIEEPSMPAEDDVRAWLLLYYTPTSKEKPAAYWPSLGKQLNSDFRKTVKTNGEVKKLAEEITASAQTPASKADLLHTYCVKSIKNVLYNAEGMSSEERGEFFKNLKETHSVSDTLRLKKGTPEHILSLFFSLAEAAGLNPIYVRGGSANGAVFRADFLDSFLLRNRFVAFTNGQDYRYYNPGIPYLPPGMLDWDEQGQPGLLADPKSPKLILMPTTKAEESSVKRKADLNLSEDGIVRGKVSQAYFGHFAVREKLSLGEMSEGSREEDFKKRLESRYPGAKITNLKLENANAVEGPLKLSYEIEMPNYAQRTGKRLFVPAGFFQLGDKPLFSAASRKQPIVFRHAYAEEDEIEIRYPEGFVLDNAEMPGKFKIADVGDYSFTANVAKAERLLMMKRNFVWAKNGMLFFDAKTYPEMKKVWDQIHTSNTTTITLKVQ